MLWNMQSVTRHLRCYVHPLHPNPTCVLPLGTVGGGRASEVDTAHLFLTLIQFHSARHLISQHTDGLWKIMAKFDCPPRFVAMVRQFHNGMQARVQKDGEFPEPFEVTNGNKQG